MAALPVVSACSDEAPCDACEAISGPWRVEPGEGAGGSIVAAAMSADGVLHMVSSIEVVESEEDFPATWAVRAFARVDGSWESATLGECDSRSAVSVVATGDIVHAAWIAPDGQSIQYSRRTSGGAWSPSVTLASGNAVRLAAGRDVEVALAYRSDASIWVGRVVDGGLESATDTGATAPCTGPEALVFGGDGRLQIFYGVGGTEDEPCAEPRDV
ncbi:MAG TPA: hypothetical protein VMZ28_07755, partial [Kofleriaceae bacterium]|nr:hypothetical protein [Kofleriaceae bacterium]